MFECFEYPKLKMKMMKKKNENESFICINQLNRSLTRHINFFFPL